MKKRTVSAETRKKISDAAKARFAKKKTPSKEVGGFQESLKNFAANVNIKEQVNCRRHPDVSHGHKESCHKCQTACLRYNTIMANKKFTLPCPDCGNSTREEDGGCIKVFYSKADHFGCGNCKISYNLKGEKVTWESGKDQDLFNRELIHRK